MTSEILRYEADGLSMESHLYLPQDVSTPRPGILVFPEAPGLSDHAKSRAERLAGLGYVTLACDLHGKGKLLTSMEAMMEALSPLLADAKLTRARAGGGFDALKARPEVDTSRIAAIGYCFGGTMSLELARGGADIGGVVGFHSGLGTPSPQDAANIKAKILVCIGADDPSIPPEQRADFEAEMRAGKADWQMHLYGGVIHSFTNPNAHKIGRPEFARYDAVADARSWAAMIALFNEIF